MNKKTLTLAIAAICCLSLLGIWFCPLVLEKDGKQFVLKSGTSPKMLITQLSTQKIIHFPWFFYAYVHLHPHQMLKAGEYHFPKGANAQTIWRQVTDGTGLVLHGFTIIPGWSFAQLRHELARTETLRHVMADYNDNEVLRDLGFAKFPSPEGQFFPETYYYTRSNPDLIILKRAITLMQSKLEEAWRQRAPNLPYKNMYEALIAASMIEKEAYLDIERPLIASVLVNRLKKDMLLQFDPTVIYGLGKRYTGKIYKENLLEDTPYNTYIHKGLPPTPIAMPSMLSIDAALHPKSTDYLYFVARGDRSHQFSTSLAQHNVAVTANANTLTVHQSHLISPGFFNKTVVKKYLHEFVTKAPIHDKQ